MKRLKEKIRRTWDWLSIYKPVETAALIAMVVSCLVGITVVSIINLF